MNSKPLLEGSTRTDEPIEDERSTAVGTLDSHALLAFRSRIEELKSLSAGWLDGKGVPPDHAGLDWLLASVERVDTSEIPAPYLFPTPEGRVLAEWSLKRWSPSLEIDLAAKRGHWHALNLDTDEERTREIDLANPDNWRWLASQIRDMSGDRE